MVALANLKQRTRKPRRKSVLDTTPHGTPIAHTEHYTAFEVSSENSASGFIAAIYRKKAFGYGITPTATCMVRGVVSDRMANLEKYLK